jgi:hypothetical protein
LLKRQESRGMMSFPLKDGTNKHCKNTATENLML